MDRKETFWLENPMSLFSEFRVIPHEGLSTASQMNSLSRLVIIVSLVLYLIGYKESILFLLIALMLIIILYYLEKGKMQTTENFIHVNKNKTFLTSKEVEKLAIEKQRASNAASQNSRLFADSEIELHFDDRFSSKNHALVGKPNPKTLIQPIIPNRSHDWQVWRNNDFNNFSKQINNRTRQFISENGYLETTPECGGNQTCINMEYGGPEEYIPRPPMKSAVKEGYKQFEKRNIENFANYEVRQPEEDSRYIDFNEGNRTNIISGDINTMCGYRPENAKYNLPVNYPSSVMQRTPEMSEYNRNIFTQHAGEDIFQHTQINEPDNWNIGISFNQQFPPTTMKLDKNGYQFQEHDPRTFKIPQGEIIDPFALEPRPDDVYDPRQTGYGPNYRTYIHEMTGQPRFFYDDINAVRRSNYITRNKIDHIPGINQTGVMRPNADLFEESARVRKIANDNFTDSMITQRVELQQRLLRKRNSDWWQRKVAPIYTSGGSGGGAGIKC